MLAQGAASGRAATLIAMGFLCRAAAAEDMQLWHEGDAQWLHAGGVHSKLGWKLAFAEQGVNLRSWELKPGVQWRPSSWLEAATTYKFAQGRAQMGEWSTSHAIEFDITPSWNVGTHGAKGHLTQRLGLTRLFDAGSPAYRYHAIPKIVWQAGCLPPGSWAESSVEAVYDFADSAWVETKITPLRLHFVADEGPAWSIGWLLNDKQRTAGAPWERTYVLVVAVAFKFAES